MAIVTGRGCSWQGGMFIFRRPYECAVSLQMFQTCRCPLEMCLSHTAWLGDSITLLMICTTWCIKADQYRPNSINEIEWIGFKCLIHIWSIAMDCAPVQQRIALSEWSWYHWNRLFNTIPTIPNRPYFIFTCSVVTSLIKISGDLDCW